MKKILAFAGSISSTSINKQLAVYAAGLLDKVEYDILNMNEYPAPLFSIDEEKNGFPENMLRLSERLKTYDGFIISLAEHNGSYAAAYKNTIDWLSRIELKVFNKKPMLLMSASPGGRGGASVLAAANAYYVTVENTTISAPSNAVEGAIISIEIAQGGTARTVAWNTVFEFAASTAPTVTATASKTDIFAFRYNGSVWQEIGRSQNMAQT